MPNGEEIVQLSRRDNDALARMYDTYKGRDPVERSDGIDGDVSPGDILIAKLTSIDGVAIGYYVLDLYQADPLLLDTSVRMSAAKLGATTNKIGPGYGFNWDELTATEHILDVGQIFHCQVIAPHPTNGKPIVRLFGNPISTTCDE